MTLLVLSDYRSPQSSRPEATLFLRLAALGHSINLITYPSSLADDLEAKGISVDRSLTRKKFDLKFIGALREKINQLQPDILFLFPNEAIINGNLAAISKPVKVVLYRGYTGNMHWLDPISYLKFLSPRVDKIICIAESVVEYLERQPTFQKGKAVTVNKGHDPAWYEGHVPTPRSELGLPENAVVAACMANARPFKGIRYLLEATNHLADLPNFYLLLIGNNMDSRSLKKLRTASKMADRILLTGYRTDPLSVLLSCDMFVLPSIKGEAITKSLIEAMSLALPPVITSVPGNRNLVIHGQNGLVAPIQSVPALVDHIRKLYLEPNLRRLFGERAQHHIQNNFHIDRTVKEITSVFEELVSS